MPLVLVAISVVLLLGAQAAVRVKREARVTVLYEMTEQAYYTAEAGVNAVRSAIIRCQTPPSVLEGTATFVDENNVSRGAGQYSVTVSGPTVVGGYQTYSVESKGEYTVGARTVKRHILADVRIESTRTVGGVCRWRVVRIFYN